MKILVVDDEKEIKRLFEQRLRRELRSGDVYFDFAFSAREALDYLEKNGAAGLTLILSDINMPYMNGLELLQIIRERYPAEIKVILITAYGDQENRQKALECGADDYLTKPIDFAILKEKIFSYREIR